MTTFVVLAHQQADLVNRLARRLAPHPVIVHWDARASGAAALDPQVVTVLPPERRHRVEPGGFSMVEAELELFRAALEVTAPDDHVVLLSGQDYPLRPVAEFAAYLRGAPHRQHARMFEITPEAGRYWGHLAGWYSGGTRGHAPRQLVYAASVRWVRRTPPTGLHFGSGSPWIALTADCTRQLLRLAEKDPAARFLRRSHSPADMFFHTLLLNSDRRSELPDLGIIEPVVPRGPHELANHHLIHPSPAKIHTELDWPEIMRSRRFFVRKVSLPESWTLLDRIDRERLQAGRPQEQKRTDAPTAEGTRPS